MHCSEVWYTATTAPERRAEHSTVIGAYHKRVFCLEQVFEVVLLVR